MTTMIYFDTLHYVKKLEASGVPKGQAEAMAEAQQEIFSECLDSTLATKSDVLELKTEFEVRLGKVESEIKWIRWVLSLVAAGVGALVCKTFF